MMVVTPYNINLMVVLLTNKSSLLKFLLGNNTILLWLFIIELVRMSNAFLSWVMEHRFDMSDVETLLLLTRYKFFISNLG